MGRGMDTGVGYLFRYNAGPMNIYGCKMRGEAVWYARGCRRVRRELAPDNQAGDEVAFEILSRYASKATSRAAAIFPAAPTPTT